MVTTTVRLPPDLHDKLRIAVVERKQKMQSLIQTAIENELKREAKTSEAASKQQTLTPVPSSTIDRSDLKSAITALVAGQSVAEPFLQAVPYPIVVKDIDSRVDWCNRQFEILANGKLEELRGMSSQEIFDLPENHFLIEAERRVVATGKPQQTMEIIGSDRLRQTLRFGICDPSGAIHRIGVIGIDFSISLQPAIGPLAEQVGPLATAQSIEPVKAIEEQRKLLAI
jgi:hypothetical protein